ncbi:MAG: transcription antitermination factor NusB [Bacteroidaceae bacterium]|nr:transcription antitermination factor NusB [Bacteroidaceae bacterium]
MINRTLIRLKVVQMMYAFYMDEGKTNLNAEKELHKSLEKSYNLYFFSLLLIGAITDYARRRIEEREEINKAAHIKEKLNYRFVDNKFVKVLEENETLCQYAKENKLSWDGEIPYLKNLYERIIASDFYDEYMKKEEVSFDDDKELWRTIYKRIISKDEEYDEVLEEKSLYWNDDRIVVDTFVLKTIKRMTEDGGCNQPMEPDYKDEEDREYAVGLFRSAIKGGEKYRDMIARNVKNWEFNRLAYMDIIIMQTAIAEFMNFPNIPASVTINEYVEIAKWYSTPRSASYVNGVLDTIAKNIKKDTLTL